MSADQITWFEPFQSGSSWSINKVVCTNNRLTKLLAVENLSQDMALAICNEASELMKKLEAKNKKEKTMSMTDQERAAMLARGFTWAAENKSIEWLFDDLVGKRFWTTEFFENFANRNVVYDVRLVSETVTAIVTIAKPLKEWPEDHVIVWIDNGWCVRKILPSSSRSKVYGNELQNGMVFLSEHEANQSMEAIRKFRTGEST